MSRLPYAMRTQAGVIAVLALAVALPVIAIAFKPATPTPTTSPGPGSSLIAAGASPTAALGETPAPTPALPTAAPTPSDCDNLPATLPAPIDQESAPVVGPRSASMLFTSFLYGRTGQGELRARDSIDDYAVGLWFAPKGDDPARLVVGTGRGVVLPLAVSHDGSSAVVWWVPERHSAAQDPCLSGIYLMALDGSSSRILLSGDWSFFTEPVDPTISATWLDPQEQSASPRGYVLPHVSFSADDRALAVITDTTIDLYNVQGGEAVRQHVGRCPRWGWSATGASFVAGCEAMTSAWYVNVAEGLEEQNVALPRPGLSFTVAGWEVPSVDAIGLDAYGKIAVARFYGFPTGCESPGCTIPSPGYSISTIDPASGHIASRGAKTDFMVYGGVEDHAWMSPDATWIYGDLDGTEARTIQVGTGEITKAAAIGRIVGVTVDGNRLFGERTDETANAVEISSLTAGGTTARVAVLTWPENIGYTALVVGVFGLIAW